MILLKNFGNIFKIPELTQKLLFTLGVLVVFRLGSFIPSIGINVSALAEHMSQASVFSGILRYFDIFSGGSLQECTIFALGISPYITASIMTQILTMAIPSLEQLSKEGDYGRKLINQYTRYLALALSIGYGFSYAMYLTAKAPQVLVSPGIGFIALFTLTLSVGSMFVMWLGEQISLFGLGNGSSMIIFAGIVSRFPTTIAQVARVSQAYPLKAVLVLIVFIIITAAIVFLEKGERKIPVQYARRVVGQKVYGGQNSYIPFKINPSGVMPVIFASTLLNLPMFIIGLFGINWLQKAIEPGTFLYSSFEFVLIIFFTYFYTAMVFNPVELADNMKKSGGFVPGIRPGKQTANYFDYILNRIGLVGAIYLGFLSIAPSVLGKIFNVPFVNGTSLLIVVSVALEFSAQIESYLIENKYEGFLSSGRMNSNRAVR